ncbi:MAG TPA: hypothetical protein VHV51_11410 [Polyangiaceae bacterium]|jgi:hypothetical protein|nr:hypothetical protein [Polyangiaceae bacterium]
MVTPRQVEQWLLQAESDLDAAEATAEGISESHTRYWLQQSYEKAIKAWGLMNWPFSADDEAQFHHVFLRRHSPFLFIDNTNAPLPKSIHLLRRAARTFVNGLAYRNVLVKLDGTTPEFDETKVSYRYPFIADGEHVAPCAYEGWNAYQGESGEVRRSVRNFIREVRGELTLFGRAPK